MENLNNQLNLDDELKQLDAQLFEQLQVQLPEGLEERVYQNSLHHIPVPQPAVAGRINSFTRKLSAAAAIVFGVGLIYWGMIDPYTPEIKLTLQERIEAYESQRGGLGDPIDQEIRALTGDVDRVTSSLSDGDFHIDQIDNPVNAVYEDLADIEAEIAM